MSTLSEVELLKASAVTKIQQDLEDAVAEDRQAVSDDRAAVETAAVQVETNRQAAVQAAQAAAEDREQTGRDRAAAEAAAAEVPAQVARVEQQWRRRNFIDTPVFTGGIGGWTAGPPNGVDLSASGGLLVATGRAGFTQIVPVQERGYRTNPSASRLRATIRVRALSGAPRIRTQLVLSNDGETSASTQNGTWAVIPTEWTTIEIDVDVAGWEFVNPRFNLADYAGHQIEFERLDYVDSELDRVAAQARQTLIVNQRSHFETTRRGEADRVMVRSTGLLYKVDASGTAATLGDGTRLSPADDVAADLRHWGALADYDHQNQFGTDCTAALRAAMQWTMLQDRVLRLPAGDFFRSTDGGSTDVNVSGGRSVRLIGEGEHATRIYFQDQNYLSGSEVESLNHLFNFSGATGRRLEFRGIAMIGRWDSAVVAPTPGSSSTLTMMGYGGAIRGGARFESVELHNLHMEGFASVCIGARGAQGSRLRATGITFKNCQRGGFNARDYENSFFLDVKSENVFDDVINVPAFSTFGPQSREKNVTVIGVQLFNAQGVCINGASRAIIQGCVGKNVNTRFISLALTPPATGSVISNNHATNFINQANVVRPFYPLPVRQSGGGGVSGISIVQAEPGESTRPHTHYEWGPDGAGGVVDPYASLGYVEPDGVRRLIPPFAVTIANNSIIQAIKPGQKWSDFNSEKDFWTRLGIKNDMVFTPDMLEVYAFLIRGPVYHTNIATNIVVGADYGICLENYDAPNYPNGRPHLDFRNVQLLNNQFVDIGKAPIYLSGRGVVDIIGGVIDGDPLLRHAGRGAGGTWTDEAALPAIQVAEGAGFTLKGVTLRNISRIYSGTPSFELYKGNTVCGEFVGLNDPANKGIRDLQIHPNRMGRVVIEGGDPADTATFQRIQQHCDPMQDAMPTAGWWLAGTVVTLSVPQMIGGNLVTGYFRVTTGTDHVLGVDWREIRSS